MTMFGMTPSMRAEKLLNVSAPFELDVFIPCVNDGAGEVVRISGTAHFVQTDTEDKSGGSHLKGHNHYQGVSGEGLTTGDNYQVQGSTGGHTISRGAESTTIVTSIVRLRFIGHGPANNFTVSVHTHITINANGEVTAEHNSGEVDCK